MNFRKYGIRKRRRVSRINSHQVSFGILSLPQGLDKILDAAKELKEHKEMIFYLIGDGMMKNHLAQRIKNRGSIFNVKLLPLQPEMNILA